MPILSCHQTATSRVSPQYGCDCTDQVHQSPLPKFYAAAVDEAEDRLAAGWSNPACPDCGHHGWLAPVASTT